MNNFGQSIIILNRRKKQVLEELEEAQFKLLMWSKRVKSSKENNRLDLLKEASFQENVYINQVKSLESQLSQLSAEIDKYKKRQSDLALSAFQKMEEKMLEIKQTEDKNLENDWSNGDFITEKQLDIDGEIKLIKNYLQKAINAVEILEFKVLEFKNNNNSLNNISIDDEIDLLKRQLRGD
ncbi:hypothetical protein GM3708_3425 [Geminocystis sp. NIES-3708]|uniref:hypothetical protein n=1 Tax=Geminocystis sp. NIES-3708 TaxID=1615909 RepID=UPI0005FCCCB0|nr:hypothetical protein [Geminocystis sp. NIES-3708]BAQ63019.1 hypothetical protein GM3708_3425 [Geminocystis sp. NIES-3708]